MVAGSSQKQCFDVALCPQKPSGLLWMGIPRRPPRLSHSSRALLSSWILYYRSNEKLTTNRWCNLWHQFILTSTSKISWTLVCHNKCIIEYFSLFLFFSCFLFLGGWVVLIHNCANDKIQNSKYMWSVQMTKYKTVNTCGLCKWQNTKQ